MAFVSSLLIFSALASLALAMPLHHRKVFHRDPASGPRRIWQVIGWSLLATSLVAATRFDEWQAGLVAWVAMLAVEGLALTLLLSYAPRVVPVISGLALLAGAGLWWR